MERMRRLRADISPHDSAQRFPDLGVDVYLGAAKFTGADTVEVGGQTLRFAKAVIATGARAAAPEIPGLDQVPYLTNETLFSLTALPKRFGVIGAGPLGCEMAQSFARFGSEVFLLATAHGVLPREDREAAGLVRAALERDGVKIVCGKDPQLTPSPGGIRIKVKTNGRSFEVEVDQLLVAHWTRAGGRRPRLGDRRRRPHLRLHGWMRTPAPPLKPVAPLPSDPAVSRPKPTFPPGNLGSHVFAHDRPLPGKMLRT